MKLLLIFAVACLAVYHTQAESLKNALGMPEAHELDQVENDFKGVILQELASLIDKFLDTKAKLTVSAQKVIDGFLKLIARAKDDLGARLKKLIEEIKSKVTLGPLRELIDKLLHGSSTEAPANGLEDDEEAIKAVLEHILKELTSDEKLEKLREYVETLAKHSKLEVVHALRELLHKLDNTKLRELIKSLLSEETIERRSLSEFLDHIKSLVKDFGLKIVEKFQPFVDWVVAQWGQMKSLLSEKVGILKAIATELLDHAHTISSLVAEEAKDIFQKYKSKLGDLYKPLMKELTGIEDATTPATF